MKKRIAIYPGTFDPFTNGHLDLVTRGLRIFDELIVAVAPSIRKKPLFTVKQRISMIRKSLEHYERVRFDVFNTLLVDYVKNCGGVAIIRGLRAVSDFEFELQMALMNRRMDSEIETVFMMPNEEYTFLTATIVKEIASFGGDVSTLVPEPVNRELNKKFVSSKG